MFHQGDLQSGIGRALQEQKLVACFVRSDNDESRIWEEQWLDNGSGSGSGSGSGIAALHRRAVLLKLDYGSTEAAFLAAFCPITTSPTLVVIDKGQVLDKIEGGVSCDEFTARIHTACASLNEETAGESGVAASASTGAAEPMESQPPTAVTTDTQEPEHSSSAQSTIPSTQTEPPISSSSDSSNATLSTPNPDMSALFPDRAQRHQVEADRRAAAEKAERTARANARKREEAQALARDKGKGRAVEETEKEKSRRDWLAQQKIRKDEAKKDRERILAQIEADKQERRARSQRAAAETLSESRLPISVDAASKRRMGAGGMCSLQVRLFDGTSIKGRFEPSATLDNNVRSWIKTTTADQGNVNAADVPFTFKQIVAPQPSRSIEVSEEHQTLADLGLTPNATLVLVPVAGYTEAYSGNAGRGYMSSALHLTYALANGASNVLGSALSYVPGLSGPTAADPTASSTRYSGSASEDEGVPTNLDGSAESIGSAKTKVKTLADQRAEAKRMNDQNPEFYNGNSSAFEGRKDDGDDSR